MKLFYFFLSLLCLPTAFSYEVTKDIIYDTINGIPLKMDRYQSVPVQGSKPAVVFIHGGCFNMGSKNDIPNEVKALADEGFVVFSLGYRLSNVAKYPAAVNDVQEAVRFIRKNSKHFGVDPKKIISHGHSAGGYLAAVLGVKPMRSRDGKLDEYSDRVELAVNWYGRTDFTLSQTEGFDCAVDFLGMPRNEANMKKFEEASILPHVDRHTSDFYIVHGTADKQVFPIHSELLTEKLKENRIKFFYLRMLNSGHGFSGGTAWKRTREFILRYK